ncbi:MULTISPECIES: hypothetical protein [unclassified Nocardiopsis]|uniref:hypothetical protein n=1 Tax=Nocardiopsis TaxID=2013 RepID=UPI00387AF9CB
MFDDLHDIDWAALEHAYGPAHEVPAWLSALRSADPAERDAAMNGLYDAVHHQGSVYSSTAAGLPFLFALAEDPRAPGRAEVVRFLVSVGRAVIDQAEWGAGDHFGIGPLMRGRAEAFAGFAAEADPRMRVAAIPGLALFLDDAERAAALLRERLAVARGVVEALVVVKAAGTLALRLPEAAEGVTGWLTDLGSDPVLPPEVRLGAVAERARCGPGYPDDDIVPAAVGLLREIARGTDGTWWRPPHRADPDRSGLPPQIAAAFEDLDRASRVHTSTTESLRTLHRALAGRVPQRTELLAGQLGSPDPGMRLDAVRMAEDLVKSWRGDHTALVGHLAARLDDDLEISAAAASALAVCGRIAEPAREALAARAAASRARYGPDVWSSPRPQERRAHQEAVLALARLGDPRAVPDLTAALAGGGDTWRAVEVAGFLPREADRLVPPLCDLLRAAEPGGDPFNTSTDALIRALARLGDPAAVPVLTDALAAAVRGDGPWTVEAALNALAGFGPAAAPALETIRPLAVTGGRSRAAAVAALWAIGRDPREVLPQVLALLGEGGFPAMRAAEVLVGIGPAGAAAAPRLREMSGDSYEWVRVHAATALWAVGGAGAPVVLDVLLQAWEQNPMTAATAVECLERMGPAAAPAVPRLRAHAAAAERMARFGGVDEDEELRRACLALADRLS